MFSFLGRFETPVKFALVGAVGATLLVRAIDGALGFGLGAARRLLPRAESAAPPEG